ncbi:GntR family transcriptional regulator [Roseiterribacter gracilis]|uniref:GntR family transcriptional regulator n=1 Tax=Roseiterribacter gracilis TaxID=2812848 RepID=A0A8S8XHQ5_9PROT|nr:GntR family transcriptional regulator [Rhodospirillales bacterium TMPK1]
MATPRAGPGLAVAADPGGGYRGSVTPDDRTPRSPGRASAAERAYTAIRRSILTGVYPPNARLIEQEIAAGSGVSRTPVREALRRLSAEGLVVFSPNQGAMVAGWSERDATEVFALRELVEVYAAACAAEQIDEASLATLRALAEAIRAEAIAARPDYITRIIDLNSRFHRSLIEAAGSARLRVMFSAVIELPLIARSYRAYSHDELLRSTAQHLAIVDAIAARDGDRAAAAMREHIQTAAQIFSQRDENDAARADAAE